MARAKAARRRLCELNRHRRHLTTVAVITTIAIAFALPSGMRV